MGETLWLFSFKTKMTYLKEWSILKMRVFGEATRCKVKVKVESGKSPDNNRAADDRLSRKSKERKRRKKTKRGISGRVPGTQGGGGGRGGDALRARAPRGQVPSALPPFPFSPSLPPEGGRTPTQLAESCIDRFHLPFALAKWQSRRIRLWRMQMPARSRRVCIVCRQRFCSHSSGSR